MKNGEFDLQYDLDSFIEDLEAEMTNLETTTKVDIDADRLAAQMQFNTHLKILNYMAQHRSHNIALKDNAEADVQSRAINFVNGSFELRNSTLKERVSAYVKAETSRMTSKVNSFFRRFEKAKNSAALKELQTIASELRLQK